MDLTQRAQQGGAGACSPGTSPAGASPPGASSSKAAGGAAGTAAAERFRKSSILARIDTAAFQSSTKIEALREEVHRWVGGKYLEKAFVSGTFCMLLYSARAGYSPLQHAGAWLLW